MLSNIDEKENLARMERGELYYAFTPELVAARRRCSQAVGRLNRAGELTRREIAEHWKECVGWCRRALDGRLTANFPCSLGSASHSRIVSFRHLVPQTRRKTSFSRTSPG